ncbi:MAG: hypothetical protein R3222_09775, partial [Balneolaceae bacterium]|nr:hypothetical protein [Balneolaceae bacterium]
MKRVLFSISLLLLILPVQVEGQSLVNKSEFSGQDEISVEETGNYNILTPVLQRDMFHSYEQANEESPGSGLSPFRSLMSSLILPGSSQARQGKWWKAGLFMAVEAASIYMIIDLRNRATNGEAQYEQFADQNWSVVQYSQWLVEYHDYHQIDNPFVEELREMVSGVHPAFNNRKDWNTVNIDLLRLVEQNTPYFTPDGLSSGFFS